MARGTSSSNWMNGLATTAGTGAVDPAMAPQNPVDKAGGLMQTLVPQGNQLQPPGMMQAQPKIGGRFTLPNMNKPGKPFLGGMSRE